MLKPPLGLLIEVTWCERGSSDQPHKFYVVRADEAEAILRVLNFKLPKQGCQGKARDVTTGEEIKLKNLY